mmetsp:Transcript_77736/g.196298  ORF Transcript_77736/g.196298 Transcript_77736/m.196298 type:complete len:357 (+) Transcript_77736:73-1143(+)
MANLVPVGWSAEGVAEGWAAEAEVRFAKLEAEVMQQCARADSAEQREASAAAEAAGWQAAAAEARALADSSDFRATAAESRAANAEAKLTGAEARATVAEAQLKLVKDQFVTLQRELEALARAKDEAEKQAAVDRKRWEVAENMLKSADDRLQAAVRSSKVVEAYAEDRVRMAEAKNDRDQKRAEDRVHSAERRAQMCEASASLVISSLQRSTTRGSSPVGKFYNAVQGKTPRSPTSSASTSAAASAECLGRQQPQLDMLRGGASAPGTPGVSRTTFAPTDWSPCSGTMHGQTPKGDGTPNSQYFGSPSRKKVDTPKSARLRSMSPVKGAPQTPTSTQMTEIRSQVSQQRKSLTHF